MFVNPWELVAHLWLKRTTTSRAFPWFKFEGRTTATRRAVSESVRAVFRTSTSFFRTSRSRQPLRVRSSSLDQTNDKIKDFPMVQIRWACETYTKSSQQKGAICISDHIFGTQEPPRSKEATSSKQGGDIQHNALPQGPHLAQQRR